MNKIWSENIDYFLRLANKHQVRMLLIGGGAVNFHGYQRHSADVDFWLDMNRENLQKLLTVFQEMNYDIIDFPDSVKKQQKNISIKFSPADLNVELITNFNINKSFQEAYKDSETAEIDGEKVIRYQVISLEDLITSKIKSGRNKDLLDILELKRKNNLD